MVTLTHLTAVLSNFFFANLERESHENHHGSKKQNHSASSDNNSGIIVSCSICISTHIIITIVINNVSLSSSFLHCFIIIGQ
jgi:hypothetical protein